MTILSPRGELAAKAVKILTDAKNHIASPGSWVKGKLMDGQTSCAIGAVMRATNTNLRNHDLMGRDEATATALHTLAKACSGHKPTSYYSQWPHFASMIYHFNDGEASHSDVIAAFDLAIEEQCKIVREEAVAQGVLPYSDWPGIDSSAWTGLKPQGESHDG